LWRFEIRILGIQKNKSDMKNVKSGVLSYLWLAVYVYATQGYLIAMGKNYRFARCGYRCWYL